MLPVIIITGGFIASIILIILIAKLLMWLIARNTNHRTHTLNSILIKKYPEFNIYRFSGVFYRIGVVLALGVVIIAFSWTTYTQPPELTQPDELFIPDFDVEIPVTKQEETKAPPPPSKEHSIIKPSDVEYFDKPEKTETHRDEAQAKVVSLVHFNVEPEFLPPDPLPSPPLSIVEQMPCYPGCEQYKTEDKKMACTMKMLREFMSGTKFPKLAKDNNIDGTVHISFVIDETGRVVNIKPAKGIHPWLDNAVIARASELPDLKPGMQGGHPARVIFHVPVKFEIR